MQARHKLKLGENHRRAMSVCLRQVEQMCESVEMWLSRRASLFVQVADDVSPDQRARVREILREVREECRQADAEMELDHKVQSRRGAILALLSVHWADLEDRKAEKLRGYGRLSDEAAVRIDARMDRLIALVSDMAGVLGRK
jgi:hypothetical protein